MRSSTKKLDTETLDLSKVLTKGTQVKKKVGGKKWETRLCVLTATHLAWFESEDAFSKGKAKGALHLRHIEKTFEDQCPPDDLPTSSGICLGNTVLFVELADGITYLFSDPSWLGLIQKCKEDLPAKSSSSEFLPMARRGSISKRKAPGKKGLHSSASTPVLSRAGGAAEVDRPLPPGAPAPSFAQCIKSGYALIAKQGTSEFKKRYLVITVDHMAWFPDWEARDAEGPLCGAVDLKSIEECEVKEVSGFKDITQPVVHVVLGGGETWYIYDTMSKKHLTAAWAESINFTRNSK